MVGMNTTDDDEAMHWKAPSALEELHSKLLFSGGRLWDLSHVLTCAHKPPMLFLSVNLFDVFISTWFIYFAGIDTWAENIEWTEWCDKCIYSLN